MDYVISVPKITNVQFSKNPSNINEEIQIYIAVSEEQKVLTAVSRPAGTFYAGEE